MALRVDSEPAQSMSGGFSLRGSANQGELVLTTPLGTTVATALWDSSGAEWRQGQQVVRKASLQALATELGGAALPVVALFSWLRGESVAVDGWQADLSRHSEGRITAQRIAPPPRAELRLIFEP